MLHFSILAYPDRLQKSIYQLDIEIDFCNLLRISIPQSYYILQKQCLSRILIMFFITSSWTRQFREECQTNDQAQTEYDYMKENLKLRKQLTELRMRHAQVIVWYNLYRTPAQRVVDTSHALRAQHGLIVLQKKPKNLDFTRLFGCAPGTPSRNRTCN